MDLAGLVARARSLADRPGRAVLGITGSPGAGKTTLAEALVHALRSSPPEGAAADWVAHLPMDGFHLADVELQRLGRLDRKGAPDTFDAAGYRALVARVRSSADEVVYAPAFDRVVEQPIAGSIPVLPTTRLVVTEGNYLLLDDGAWSPLRPLLDEVWFCALDGDERQQRLVHRHTVFGKQPSAAVAWVREVDERNAQLVETTRGRADLVVPSDVLRSIGGPPRVPGAAGAEVTRSDGSVSVR